MPKTDLAIWFETVEAHLCRLADALEAAADAAVTGPKGDKGDKGDPGDTGPPGLPGAPGAPGFQSARMAADVALVGNGVWADLPGLQFTALAGRDYVVEAYVLFQSAAGGTGVSLGLRGPAGPAAVAGYAVIPNTAAAAQVRPFRAYDSGTPSGGVDAPNADVLAKLEALVRIGATGGPVVVRFAPGGAAQVTARAGSSVRWREIGP